MNITRVVSILLLLTLMVLSCCHADEYHQVDNHARRAILQRETSEDAAYWNNLGQQLLKDEINKQRVVKTAKNIIFFLGDGMSISTVTAARIYKGQKKGQTGEEEQLNFDKFPYTALSRTYCTDSQVADSACSATAYLCGVKTDIDTIGIDYNVEYKNCDTQNVPANQVDSIMDWAQDAAKATGIVTTTRVTHATPAGTYAHVANRDWEDDSMLVPDGADSNNCDDIAEQLIRNNPGNKFKVILGGGRGYFTPTSVNDSETGLGGRRLDGVNLIDEWKTANPSGVYVESQQQLLNVDINQVDKVLGLFSPGHMEYFLESANANNPSLEEMTRVAIKMLQKEANGFVLLVEGGRIDQAHHDGRAKLALEEAIQLDNAVQAALELTDTSDTLIIVTADHSHTMTINGYPVRGNNLLGLSGSMGTDYEPYTTLSYANGPGYNVTFVNGIRVNLSNIDTTSDSFKQPAGVPLNSETHGGDDVAVFAIGPHAHLFQGVYEQHYIAHVMGYAACIGPGLKYCDGNPPVNSSISPTSSTMLLILYSSLVALRIIFS